MAETLNVVSVCGSLRKGSYNRMVMSALPGLAPADMHIKEAPPFSEFPLLQRRHPELDRVPRCGQHAG